MWRQGGSLRIGYAYRFHSSVIVYYDDTPYCDLRNRPLKKSFPPVSTWILTFEEITTDKTGYQLTSDDLEFGWLTEDVMEMLMKELGAQRGLWRNTLDEVIDSLHDLSVESLKRVVKYIKLGMPDVEINKLFLNT